ncbi:JmjC domain-containing protein [Streptomyces sp. MMBL 11-1]|uniref:JmjC domain-containing protein n=1 Tax=Streptomyces sp. MMBL 11-1 TaxID=3026420 RepID=UPI00235F4AB0|nr:cupin domain-containing protein [Streptomyces sp. MMBL 11-1]
MALSTLITDPESVLAAWPRTPRLYHHAADTFADLLTLDEVNELIDEECIAMRNLVLIKDGSLIERRLFGDGDLPYPGAVREHINNGGTISLRQLQELRPSISRLRREVQAATGCLVHANAYLTPPDSQGLKYHYDPYVTLIIQIAGRKAWPLHPPIVENPTKEHGNFLGRGFTHEERVYLANTPPAQTFTLEPGDVFWLPRGYLHSPHTVGEETSLHITLAMKERTAHWVAEQMASEILEQAIVDPAMREELQPAALFRDPVAAVNDMRTYLQGALMLMDTKEMGERLVRVARRVA